MQFMLLSTSNLSFFADHGTEDKPSTGAFKYVLIHDKQIQPQLNIDPSMEGKKELEANLDSKATEPEETYSFTKDKISIVNSLHLFDTSTIQQLFLIGKVLGESLPIKLITSTCAAEWKFSRDFSIIDLGNGYI